MGMPYSNDLRLRVLAAVDGGVPVRQVVALLRVSVSYTSTILSSVAEGRVRRRRGCRADARPRKLAGHEQAVLTRLGAEPDRDASALRDWLASERGVTV